jgi:hypothetical protein
LHECAPGRATVGRLPTDRFARRERGDRDRKPLAIAAARKRENDLSLARHHVQHSSNEFRLSRAHRRIDRNVPRMRFASGLVERQGIERAGDNDHCAVTRGGLGSP